MLDEVSQPIATLPHPCPMRSSFSGNVAKHSLDFEDRVPVTAARQSGVVGPYDLMVLSNEQLSAGEED